MIMTLLTSSVLNYTNPLSLSIVFDGRSHAGSTLILYFFVQKAF